MELRSIIKKKPSIKETLKYNPWAAWFSTIGLLIGIVICWWIIRKIIAE